jgi:hypothetical protein
MGVLHLEGVEWQTLAAKQSSLSNQVASFYDVKHQVVRQRAAAAVLKNRLQALEQQQDAERQLQQSAQQYLSIVPGPTGLSPDEPTETSETYDTYLTGVPWYYWPSPTDCYHHGRPCHRGGRYYHRQPQFDYLPNYSYWDLEDARTYHTHGYGQEDFARRSNYPVTQFPTRQSETYRRTYVQYGHSGAGRPPHHGRGYVQYNGSPPTRRHTRGYVEHSTYDDQPPTNTVRHRR